MKRNFVIPCILILYASSLISRSCRKQYDEDFNPQDTLYVPPSVETPVIRTSFTEEFLSRFSTEAKGWQYGSWGSGFDTLMNKGMMVIGFPAYSYQASKTEYVGSFPKANFQSTANSWLQTPPILIKEGSRISFFTRQDTESTTERLQVRINKSKSTDAGVPWDTTSVGSYTFLILEINAPMNQQGYPANWQKFEYTFTGITDSMVTRIAFRHIVPSNVSKGIGIDQFVFQQ
jgi:hypothetical protein